MDIDSGLYRELQNIRETAEQGRIRESGAYFGTVISQFQSLNGLRGFWPFSSRDNLGNPIDLSCQGRTLSASGGTYGWSLANGAPYMNFDGVNGYVYRADEAGLDISYNMTVGGWFYLSSLPANSLGLVGKWYDGGVNQRNYLLFREITANRFRFYVSSNGTATTYAENTTYTPASGTWYFIVGRLTVSSEMAIWVNASKATNTTSIPSSLYNSTAPLEVGRWDGGGAGAKFLPGRAALVFLCSEAVADASIARLYNISRQFFGV